MTGGGFVTARVRENTLWRNADTPTHTSADAQGEAALAVERAIYGDLFVVVLKLRTETRLRQ